MLTGACFQADMQNDKAFLHFAKQIAQFWQSQEPIFSIAFLKKLTFIPKVMPRLNR